MKADTSTFVLRYVSLYSAGRSFAFPCDAQGTIDLDALPPRVRSSVFAARALVGREFAFPVVEPVHAP